MPKKPLSSTWSSGRRSRRASVCRPTRTVSSLSPLDLLDLYWRSSHMDPADMEALHKLAGEILSKDNGS